MPIFSVFIHSELSSRPTSTIEVASEIDQVRTLAERALAYSADRLAVEVRLEDQLVFTLDRNGLSWPANQPDV